MKALHGIRKHPVQWIVFSGVAYLFIGGFVGLFFHEGPLIHTGDQYADIPFWMNIALIGASISIGTYCAHKETKVRH